ncbi:nuclear transport factor 2 family protein [Roseisolibacter sp. H3M3-2]|uniref:nuclear transport factor 2 family protein n=1 Tax=Roseisolibacter sp. H3M3-2 TaxID=3031323 RepID=UPI0023DBF343|nr:nuclear transport factor 2 family protein [Roseisolibacter sp. H3M3-2]MDF1505484.1 nuclear transport factor 2 family protein [Roseisolibacter sp. H3M3-2]
MIALLALGAALAALPPGPPAPTPRERAVLETLRRYEAAALAEDTVTLKRIWADDYTFITTQGAIFTRAQRLANYASGATNVTEAFGQRDITVRVAGDQAVVRQIFTLRARFGGQVTDTEVRCTFVWRWRGGRWEMVTNQLTAVAP